MPRTLYEQIAHLLIDWHNSQIRLFSYPKNYFQCPYDDIFPTENYIFKTVFVRHFGECKHILVIIGTVFLSLTFPLCF